MSEAGGQGHKSPSSRRLDRRYDAPEPMSEADAAAQKSDWEAFRATCHADGRCEFSGNDIVECQRTICDCFESPEGARLIRAESRLRKILELCNTWDGFTKGESSTTKQIRDIALGRTP